MANDPSALAGAVRMLGIDEVDGRAGTAILTGTAGTIGAAATGVVGVGGARAGAAGVDKLAQNGSRC